MGSPVVTGTEMDSYASAAATAFEDVELAALLLEKKQRALTLAVTAMAVKSSDESRQAYFEHTENVLGRYEEKRAKAGLA